MRDVAVTTASYRLSRRRPELMKRLIRKGVSAQLPEGFDVDTHFKPAYVVHLGAQPGDGNAGGLRLRADDGQVGADEGIEER